ncbi:hypothetical protein HMPREF9080_02597 [Cardiobacterium valvarum F0432]|uniref:Uncharacterized protein n=1 Tax=Cardiobacterium valvarum F0432 TaxID=797473 RepID=G9ZIH3_9GAMM|nr:hypothetical protein HMPREF9080_02597 [Cardiobacterium valvarum F0432]
MFATTSNRYPLPQKANLRVRFFIAHRTLPFCASRTQSHPAGQRRFRYTRKTVAWADFVYNANPTI